MKCINTEKRLDCNLYIFGNITTTPAPGVKLDISPWSKKVWQKKWQQIQLKSKEGGDQN